MTYFLQYFPKLKKLSLSIIDPSLANNVDRKRHAYYNCKPHEVLRGITNLSELEEFRFFFKYDGYRIESQDSFLDELARSCPNLKAVTLFGKYYFFTISFDLKKVKYLLVQRYAFSST